MFGMVGADAILVNTVYLWMNVIIHNLLFTGLSVGTCWAAWNSSRLHRLAA